jgi:NDP-sugar pyrophosphorylase family protein
MPASSGQGGESSAGPAQVVILAGGQGKRFGRPDLPKALLPVGDSTLIEHLIDLFIENGFREFVLLVGHLHHKIVGHLGDGSDRDVTIDYSADPRAFGGVGKGKALKHALRTGAVDRDRHAIIAHPDDILLDRRLPSRLFERQMKLEQEFGALATLVLTKSFRVPYGVVESLDDRGLAMRFEEKPTVRLLVSTGMCAMSPAALRMVEEVVNMEERGAVEYETVLYTKLANQRKLGTLVIPPEEWLSVNDLKEYEVALQRLTAKGGVPAAHREGAGGAQARSAEHPPPSGTPANGERAK